MRKATLWHFFSKLRFCGHPIRIISLTKSKKKKDLELATWNRLSLSLPLSWSASTYFLFLLKTKINTFREPQVNGFYLQRPSGWTSLYELSNRITYCWTFLSMHFLFLFVLYVTDLPPSVSPSSCAMFADDSLMYNTNCTAPAPNSSKPPQPVTVPRKMPQGSSLGAIDISGTFFQCGKVVAHDHQSLPSSLLSLYYSSWYSCALCYLYSPSPSTFLFHSYYGLHMYTFFCLVYARRLLF